MQLIIPSSLNTPQTLNMQALVTSPPSEAIVTTIPVPKPGRGELLVRVKAIALNPNDAFYVAKPNGVGKVVGSDFAGVVEGVGDEVDERRIGENVAGFVHGGLLVLMRLYEVTDKFLSCTACHENVNYPGAFAEYTIVDQDLVFTVPQEITLEEAATLPLCVQTAANVSLPLTSYIENTTYNN